MNVIELKPPPCYDISNALRALADEIDSGKRNADLLAYVIADGEERIVALLGLTHEDYAAPVTAAMFQQGILDLLG